MSLSIAIDTAIKRGASPSQIARIYGVSIASIEKRVEAIAHRSKVASERRIKHLEMQLRHERPKSEPLEEVHARDKRAMDRWLALPIRYENYPERAWNPGAAARNDAMLARRRSHFRTLGGVADYSSVPEAA